MINEFPLAGIKSGGSMPILDYVRLQATPEELTITGGNMEVFTRRRVPGKFDVSLDTCVPLKILQEWTDKVSGPFKFTQDGGKLKVSAGRNRTTLVTADPEDYPWVPSHGDLLFTCSLTEFQTAAKKVSFAAARNAGRPVLEQVYLNNGEIVATDGFRLAFNKFSYQGFEHSVLVSPEALLAVFGMTGETLSVEENSNRIIFSTENEQVICTPLNETYVDYVRLFSSKFEAEITIDANKLLRAILTNLLFREFIHLVISQDGDIQVWSSGAETGDCSVLEEAKIAGISLEIFVDGRYLAEGLKRVSGDVVLKAEGKEGRLQVEKEDWIYIVMTAKETV